MKIKGLFGVRSLWSSSMVDDYIDATFQEDKLVVFDPKAMHHIFVKVCCCAVPSISFWLIHQHWTGSRNLWRAPLVYIVSPVVLSLPTDSDTYCYRLNALAFGEGLLSTLGGAALAWGASRKILTFRCQGSQHRKQRKMLNSVFSIAHLRSMGACQIRVRATLLILVGW